MLERSVAAVPEGMIVEPYCVREGGVQGLAVVSTFVPPLSVKVAGSPAFDQSMARLGDRIPLHGYWAREVAETVSDTPRRMNMNRLNSFMRKCLCACHSMRATEEFSTGKPIGLCSELRTYCRRRARRAVPLHRNQPRDQNLVTLHEPCTQHDSRNLFTAERPEHWACPAN